MVTITYVQPDGNRDDVDAKVGDSVMWTAVTNQVPGIIGDCGGGMSCGTCHVFVEETWLDTVGRSEGYEDDILATTATERTPQSRLGCQLLVDPTYDGLVVHVPVSQE